MKKNTSKCVESAVSSSRAVDSNRLNTFDNLLNEMNLNSSVVNSAISAINKRLELRLALK